MRQVVLVNGVPASGKSTVARDLSVQLSLPAFGIDVVKEALFEHLGTGDREYNRLLGRASYEAIFRTIGAFPSGLVALVEAWHGFQPRETVECVFSRNGIGKIVEVWCHAPPDVLAERYTARARERHAGHPQEAYAKELKQLAQRAHPLGFGPVVDVCTDGTVDIEALARTVSSLLGGVKV